MNVLFLNPPYFPRFSRESRSPAVTKSDTLYYPKWLAYAAGVAIQNKHRVDLVDAPAGSHSVEYISDRMEAKKIEAVVMDTSTPSIQNDIGVLQALRRKHPQVKFILVGRHVSAMPRETFALAEEIEYIALREYELIVRDWLNALAGGSMESVGGLVWRNNGEIIQNAPGEPVEDLDGLPFVSEIYKQYLNINDYFYGHSQHPLIVFDTSRGCPHHCSFCAFPQTFSGRKMRYRSVSNVADEFEFVSRELPGIKSIMLEDDTFIVSKKRTRSLAEELIRRGNRIPFNANCRADVTDVELLKLLASAGARLFCVGFESGDEKILDSIHKNLDLNKAAEFVKACREAKIMLHGCFMVGNPNETFRTLEKTLALAKRLNTDTAQFYPIMVYPGTEAYEDAKKKGYLRTENFSDWLTKEGLHNSVINLPNITNRQLVEFCDRARREYYLRPSYILMKLKQSFRNKDEFLRNWKGFKTLFKYLIRGSF